VSASDKTEKATPKRRDEARKKGQVSRSTELNGAVVLFASLMALAVVGPNMVHQLQDSLRHTLALTAHSDKALGAGLGTVLRENAMVVVRSVAPVAGVAMAAGILINVAQVRLKLTPAALRPDPKRLNPLQGAKNIFGQQALFEGGKTIVKLVLIGGVAAAALLPSLPEMAALVGLPPDELLARAGRTVLAIAKRAAIAYLLIAIADVVWQRRRFEKQLRMDKEEVKREAKEQTVSPEVRGAIRRRQMQASRARMMAAVPTADVVVTNPTHFSVALRYDGSMQAPEVVAKGQDLIALQIRRIAREHDVPIVPDPPLARSLHAGVEIGQQVPEGLYAAVAQVLAFVYSTARRSAV
jgi:flagellar biosynthetic protein FlhB